jgi:hypothetical protein
VDLPGGRGNPLLLAGEAGEIGSAHTLRRAARLASRAAKLLPPVAIHAAALAVAGLVLVSSGQPIFAEDTWWHLSMGAAYARSGPWLAEDPLLHTAQGPPAPAAWLSDLALHALERALGFTGLRVGHALLVAASLALAWSLLRRAARSALFASFGAALFAALGAYRFFQLRPELVTILATLLLYRLLLEGEERPSWRRVAAAAGLMGLWANLHAGFVLGLVLVGAAGTGLAAAVALLPERRGRDLPRARRLAAALGVCMLATLANPGGASPHLLYLAAGDATPDLALVADEWAPLRLLALPVPNLPPSPLSWAVVWALLLATPVGFALALRRRSAALDPALTALAATSLAGMLGAVRLSWLAIFPLLWLGRFGPRPRRGLAWTGALASLLLAPAFLRLGDWPMISRGVDLAAYASPYPVLKYPSHAVWFLRDAGLEGKLWNDYVEGNFLGYWLAPRLRVFVNGSLNVPPEVMDARAAALAREGLLPGESFEELLERYRIDVFFGSGLPVVALPGRPRAATTAHLAGSPGWIPVFRNALGAVYLRNDERNRANLGRVADYYARAGVPFDPGRGFEVERVVREAPRWAVEQAIVPSDFAELEGATSSLDPERRRAARERLAALLATLGLYARAEAIDRRALREDPDSLSAARRLVWSLLRQGRAAESLAAAEVLESIAEPQDALSAGIVAAAREAARPGADAAGIAARLPVFARQQIPWVLTGLREPEARSPASPP